MKKKIRTLIIVAAAVVVVIAGIVSGLIIRKKIKDKTVNIAFYGLSDDYINLIKEYIPQNENLIIKYDVLAPGAIELGVVTKKYDMLFTWKGDVTDALSGGIETIPAKLLENIPMSLRDKYCMPILLNHFEFDLYKPVVEKTGASPADDFSSLISYLDEAKKYVFSPFFCNGGDDRVLLALTGSIVEAEGGVTAYNKLIEAMRSANSLDEFADVELADIKTAGSEYTLTFRSVLDMLKQWPVEGMTHPQWFQANEVDVQVFAEDKQLAGIFTTLSEHRTFKYRVISDYETIRMPALTTLNTNEDHGLIAPAICCCLITNNSNAKNFLKNLILTDNQSAMSTKSMLAPVQYRAEAYDVQSDDVRFWAASCAGGAMPDLSLAVYQRKPELQADIAKEIRNYLR